ncbi:MAG: DUF3592 domain-containing protein [Hyphomicrobiaceae bacterium]
MRLRLNRDRAEFVAWWSQVGGLKRGVAVLVMTLMALAATGAIVVMGPRLAREGRLLWFGRHADGIIVGSSVEQVGAFKGGAPRYRLTLRYTFATPDGRRFAGTTLRTDVRDPPAFVRGDAIGVYYEAASPDNSVAEHNLRTDVYALALFLPFLVVMGFAAPAWFLYGALQRSREKPA